MASTVLSLHVVALPLKGVMLSYADTASAREVKGTVARRGLCGDVYLVSTPRGARIADVRVDTSVREGRVSLDAALEGLAADGRYRLRAGSRRDGREVADLRSPAFTAADLARRPVHLRRGVEAGRLWDLHTPGNLYTLARLAARRGRPRTGHRATTCASGSANSGSRAATSS